MITEEFSFVVDGIDCAAVLTSPETTGDRLPAVCSGPGFGGVKEMLLPDYGKDLADRGVASLAFDYPGFGASGGTRRQQVDPAQQLRTFRAALDTLAHHQAIDADRIGLWGTSLAGGHALVVAGTDPRVRAVAALIPFIDLKPTGNLSLAPIVVRDTARRMLGRPGLTVPIGGHPGEVAAMNSDGAFEWLQDMAAGAANFRNEVTVASLLKMLRWSTRTATADITVPVLAVLAESDTITPPDRVRNALANVPDVTYLSFPDTHFELFGEHGQSVRTQTADWLASQLQAP